MLDIYDTWILSYKFFSIYWHIWRNTYKVLCLIEIQLFGLEWNKKLSKAQQHFHGQKTFIRIKGLNNKQENINCISFDQDWNVWICIMLVTDFSLIIYFTVKTLNGLKIKTIAEMKVNLFQNFQIIEISN